MEAGRHLERLNRGLRRRSRKDLGREPEPSAGIVDSRSAKDHERLCSTGEAFGHAAMTRLIVRRLARA